MGFICTERAYKTQNQGLEIQNWGLEMQNWDWEIQNHGLEMQNNTGLPTKDATSTTTVQLFSTHILTNYMHCNSLLTLALFAMLFINVSKGHTKSKNRNSFKFAWFKEFYVVAEFVSFVDNPVA